MGLQHTSRVASSPVCAVFVAALLAACGHSAGQRDAGSSGDAGLSDAGGHDAGSDDGGSDAGSSVDAGSDAGSAQDAGTTDAGSDAGSIQDAGTNEDAGTDAGSVEDAGTDGGSGDAGSEDAGVDAGSDGGVVVNPQSCDGSVATSYTPLASLPAAPGGLTVPSGFTLEAIAQIGSARELAALPNGDLLVATSGSTVMLIPNAEADGNPGAPVTFATLNDSPAQGIAYDANTCTIYIGAQHGIYSIPYADAQVSADAGSAIAAVRTGSIAPNSDGDVHVTTSVAVADGGLYAGVGSSCNACVEVDPTRAVVLAMGLDGSNVTTRATRVRNAIALAENPATGTLWAGGAGQDDLPTGHPYEYFDAVTIHDGIADYGWPACEENQHAYIAGSDCSNTVEPLVELPAYSTIIGAVFYSADLSGTYAFPTAWRGLYLTGHGSWHATDGVFDTPPRVAFVPISGDTPGTAVNWSDPTVQWTEFSGGWQTADGKSRIARATGIAVGARGSLFVADDQGGYILRIRPQSP